MQQHTPFALPGSLADAIEACHPADDVVPQGGNGPGRATQVRKILELMSGIPGGSLIKLVTRNFPQVSDAAHSHFEECERWFSADRLPPGLDDAADAEEVVVTLEGQSPIPVDRSELLAPLWKLLDDSEMDATWDVRARITETDDSRKYELTVFTNQFPGQSNWA